MNLYINACVKTQSRTRHLAEYLIEKLNMPFEEVRISEIDFPRVDQQYLNMRDSYSSAGDFSAPCFDLARQFAEAETIVIAAPYWDLSFPAALKNYFEQINVTGLTFEYSPEGTPIGLCRAKTLYYVTTAGGCYVPAEYGFGYVEALARNFYGIENVHLIKAEGLDIVGNDVSEIIIQAEAEIDERFSSFE